MLVLAARYHGGVCNVYWGYITTLNTVLPLSYDVFQCITINHCYILRATQTGCGLFLGNWTISFTAQAEEFPVIKLWFRYQPFISLSHMVYLSLLEL